MPIEHYNLKLYTVSETMQLLNMSRQTYYNEINSGRLKSVKVGTRRFNTAAQIKAYIDMLEKEQGD